MSEGKGSVLLERSFDPKSEKLKEEYGVKIAKALYDKHNFNTGDCFRRNEQWELNEDFCNGKNSAEEYYSYLGIEGNNVYVNIDMTINIIFPKFKEIILNRFMERVEKPVAVAIDDASTSLKELEKQEARFRMLHREQIEAIEQSIGAFGESSKYIPEDEEDLALHFDLENRLPEEILFELATRRVLNDNKGDFLKRKLLDDVQTFNFASTKLYYDAKGDIRIKRCNPKNLIYDSFETDNAEDASFIGEIVAIKLTDLIRMYKLSDKDLQDVKKKAIKHDKKDGSGLMGYDRHGSYSSNEDNDYSVLVFDFEIKTVDVDVNVKTTNKFGNTLLVPKKSVPNADSGMNQENEIIEEAKINVYNGIWICGTDIMLKWGISENMIRPYQSGVDAYFSYSIITPNNTGSLSPSLVQRAIPTIRQMIIIRLKIQQMISLMKVDGIIIDINGFQGVDIGTGSEMKAVELMKIYHQSGIVYYDSKDDGSGERRSPPVQQGVSVSNVAQLNILVNQYNFELDRLREEIGISEYKDGSGVPVRTGVGVMNNQIQASNNAIEYIYWSYSSLMEETLRKSAMMLWDSVVLRAKKFKEFEGYELSLLDMTFDISMKLQSDDSKRQQLNDLLNLSIEQKMISVDQVFKIQNIEDTKLAELYLTRAIKRNKKEEERKVQINMQNNSQQSQQSAQDAMELEAQKDQILAKNKIDVNKVKSEGDKELSVLNFSAEMIKQSFISGKALPAEMELFVNSVIKNAVQPQIEQHQQDVAEHEALTGQDI